MKRLLCLLFFFSVPFYIQATSAPDAGAYWNDLALVVNDYRAQKLTYDQALSQLDALKGQYEHAVSTLPGPEGVTMTMAMTMQALVSYDDARTQLEFFRSSMTEEQQAAWDKAVEGAKGPRDSKIDKSTQTLAPSKKQGSRKGFLRH